MYVVPGNLRGLGILSDSKQLISYLIEGYISGLGNMIPTQVNLYTADKFREVVTTSVSLVVNAAAISASNTLIPSVLSDTLANAYTNSFDWTSFFNSNFDYRKYPSVALFRFAIDTYKSSFVTAFRAALGLLTPSLLSKWSPTSANFPGGKNPDPGKPLNVDTSRAQQTVNQNAAASGSVAPTESFFSQYGLYLAAGVALLLLTLKGK